MKKCELPLDTDQSIADLVAAFEDRTLPIENWTHRAHLAVGASYARSMSRSDALQQLRERIQIYNLANNNPTGYNETITRLFLGKMASDIESGIACASLVAEVARLATICTVEWLYTYYSKSLLHSNMAKRQWVEPDCHAIDFCLE